MLFVVLQVNAAQALQAAEGTGNVMFVSSHWAERTWTRA